jgi:hypothetical protein
MSGDDLAGEQAEETQVRTVLLDIRGARGDGHGMTTQQRIDRLEDALSALGTIIEAEGRWAKSENPTVRVFGEKFNEFVAAVAKERYGNA